MNLWISTTNLYDRFDLKPSLKNATNGIVEESAELLEELNQANPENVAEEFADLMVVGISGMLARGLTLKDLERGMLKVINKNDSKNHNTHVVYNHKITKKEKVVTNNEGFD